MSPLSADLLIPPLKNLGKCLEAPHVYFQEVMMQAQHGNGWFTPAEVERAMQALGRMLNESDLNDWLSGLKATPLPKKVGLILAGNVPLVGFHDVLCVLVSGHTALIKMSSSDDKLLPAVLSRLISLAPFLADRIQYTTRFTDFDAVIATGSNNSSRYFDYYFGKVPNIIRKNRNSIAILNGRESEDDLSGLGHDLFDYFGLGCRNVSKIYFPTNYAIEMLFKPLENFQPVIHHFKYHNNYDYNKSIYLVNGVRHYDNGFLLVKEDPGLASPLAVIYYETYDSLADMQKVLDEQKENIQCVVTALPLRSDSIVAFGESQHPHLWDYADNIDTLKFLENL